MFKGLFEIFYRSKSDLKFFTNYTLTDSDDVTLKFHLLLS